MPREGDLRSPGASELNAVQLIRFETGTFLAAHQQRNLIQVLDARGGVMVSHRWEHLGEDLARREDGTLEGMPGYTFSVRCWDGERAVLVDGTARRLMEIDHAGSLLGTYLLPGGVMWAGRTRDGRLLAAGGPDRVVELSPRGRSEDPISGRTRPEAASVQDDDLLTPRLLLPEPERFLAAHGIHRERWEAPGDRPDRLTLTAGDSLLYLGYPDGLGVVLDLEDSLRVAALTSAVERAYLTGVHAAGGRFFAADYGEGITPLHPPGPRVPFPEPMRFRGLVPLTPGTWLAVARRGGWRVLRWELSGHGLEELVALEGRDGPAVELLPLPDGRVLMVDRDHLETAHWVPGTPPIWRPIKGTGFQEAERHGLFGHIAADVEGAVPLGMEGMLLLWSSRFEGDRVRTRIELVGEDGSVTGRWSVLLSRSLSGVAVRRGTVYLLTDDGLYVWEPGA